MSARDCLPGSKMDGASVELSPPASAEVKKEWSYTSILHLFVACTRITLHPLPFSENLIMREAV